MTAVDGDRPAAPPRPTNPSDGPPRLGLDDPVRLSRASHILQTALARHGLTVSDLRPPKHVRAA
jgi:hypothetical protein